MILLKNLLNYERTEITKTMDLKELLREAYKAGRRNALKRDELNSNDFINKHLNEIEQFKKEQLIAFLIWLEEDPNKKGIIEIINLYLETN